MLYLLGSKYWSLVTIFRTCLRWAPQSFLNILRPILLLSRPNLEVLFALWSERSHVFLLVLLSNNLMINSFFFLTSFILDGRFQRVVQIFESNIGRGTRGKMSTLSSTQVSTKKTILNLPPMLNCCSIMPRSLPYNFSFINLNFCWENVIRKQSFFHRSETPNKLLARFYISPEIYPDLAKCATVNSWMVFNVLVIEFSFHSMCCMPNFSSSQMLGTCRGTLNMSESDWRNPEKSYLVMNELHSTHNCSIFH